MSLNYSDFVYVVIGWKDEHRGATPVHLSYGLLTGP
jgi:hypothetical protein